MILAVGDHYINTEGMDRDMLIELAEELDTALDRVNDAIELMEGN